MGNYTWEIVAPDDGRNLVYYAASSIGFCPKALFYDRQGITHEPTPQWMQERYDAGTDNEAAILEMLYRDKPRWAYYNQQEKASRGFRFGEYMEDRGKDYSDQIQVSVPIGSNVIVQGHMDELAYFWLAGDPRQGEIRGVEAKFFGPSFWNIFKRKGLAGFPKYQWQVSVLMRGAGQVLGLPYLPFLFVVGEKDDNGKLVGISIEQVDEPPIKWAQVIGKVMGIEKRVLDNNPPDCDKPLMYPCPFYPYHDEESGLEVDETKLFLLESLAAEYDRHGAIAKEHNAKKKAIAKEIQAFFDDEFGVLVLDPDKRDTTKDENTGSRTVLTPNLKVTDVGYWGEGDVDATLLAKDGIDAGKYRKPGYEVRYPKVTKRAGGKGDIDADPFHGLPKE